MVRAGGVWFMCGVAADGGPGPWLGPARALPGAHRVLLWGVCAPVPHGLLRSQPWPGSSAVLRCACLCTSSGIRHMQVGAFALLSKARRRRQGLGPL